MYETFADSPFVHNRKCVGHNLEVENVQSNKGLSAMKSFAKQKNIHR